MEWSGVKEDGAEKKRERAHRAVVWSVDKWHRQISVAAVGVMLVYVWM